MRTRATLLSVCLLFASLVGAGAGLAAQAPTVTTRPATGVTDQAATLVGTVNPQAQATTYFFEYGTSQSYGQRTPDQSAGAGTGNSQVSFGITGLSPSTTYHYRIVAVNASGTVFGGNRAFTTRSLPSGLTISASPNPVVFGNSVAISGALSGASNSGRQVILQANPYPYTQGFLPLGNPQLTGPSGQYSFRLAPLLKARYRVVAGAAPFATSPEIVVGVRVLTTMHVSDSTPRRGSRVRFYGSAKPLAGSIVSIQKKASNGRYVSVARTRLRRVSGTRATYSRRIRVSRSGRYRVWIRATGAYNSGISPSRQIRAH
jgi:hypothetical protein